MVLGNLYYLSGSNPTSIRIDDIEFITLLQNEAIIRTIAGNKLATTITNVENADFGFNFVKISQYIINLDKVKKEVKPVDKNYVNLLFYSSMVFSISIEEYKQYVDAIMQNEFLINGEE